MKIECLRQTGGKMNREILADFLRTLIAVAKYGRTTIYDGEIYYLPYTMMKYKVKETGEVYTFIASEVSDDVSVYKEEENIRLVLAKEDARPEYVIEGKKNNSELLEEVGKKIQLNKKMRKTFQKYQFDLTEVKTVYLPEQTFYGRGKKEYLFLVDHFLQKVDFKNLLPVEEQFAKNYLKEQNAR